MTVSYTVPEAESGRTVYSVLRHTLGFSAAMTRRLKNAAAIHVDGQNVFTTHVLRCGQHVLLSLDAAEPPCGVEPEDGPLEVLYEDDGLLAVNKPEGCLTHPSHARYTGTLAGFVCGYLAAHGGLPCCHAVNRLDRDTSGVVLFAKNSYMMERLSAALQAPEAGKEYLALVLGVPSPAGGVIDLPIARASAQDLRRIVAPGGQRAVTRYETVCSGPCGGETVSLLRLRLMTGRTHQIRVHCQAMGFPLLGDRLYGTGASAAFSQHLGLTAHALHAETLSFVHPLTGLAVRLRAPLRRPKILDIISQIKY